MRQLIAGNWKMNGSAAMAADIGAALAAAADLPRDLLVCPPATLIAELARLLAGSAVAVGGQDCHARSSGAHTGDIAAPMLRDAGATWVILGHSERRADHAETNEIVYAKVLAAVAAGLTPIVCVGETEAESQAGQAQAVIGAQLAGSLPEDFAGAIAYEPVWAIGTGKIPTEADVTTMHGFIRGRLKELLGPTGEHLLILYGGSVKPDNAAALLALPEVGGALVGGASLKAADFLAIANAA